MIEERSVDDANGRFVVEDEGDGDAEHGEEVDVVDGAVQRVNAPCGTFVDEVVATRTF